MDERAIANIKARIEQCRRLAVSTTDGRVSRILIQMAEEAEADLKRIEAESAHEPAKIEIHIDPAPGS